MYKESKILVPLVNTSGEIQGYGEKLAVHERGELHLAFSVMLFRLQHDGVYFLLQQRANGKYHSGNAWSNTCCSHPLPNEHIATAARRRLKEELGIDKWMYLHDLKHIIYRSELDNKMIEHEFDIILAGQVSDVETRINPEEVNDVKWWSQRDIENALRTQPEIFTVWFHDVYERVNKHIYAQGRQQWVSNA